jgi:GTP-binding protein Era
VTRSGFVAVVGRPNVGKSTLTNRIIGDKVAIVSAVPQTTRRRIRGFRNLPGGQIVLVDTPGIHKPRHTMNRWMMGEATEAIREVDLILFLISADPGRGRGAPPTDLLGPGDRYTLSLLPRTGTPVLLAVNKVDRVRRKADLLPRVERVKDEFPFAEILLLSALTGENMQGIPEKLLSYLPEGQPLYPEEFSTDESERALTSEIIREKLLHKTREEIPHETCVLIDSFVEKESGFRAIEASILVEKNSQKKIVIGRGGELLKRIGTDARRELEVLLGGKVFLKLWVRVRAGWRDDERTLRELGLRK